MPRGEIGAAQYLPFGPAEIGAERGPVLASRQFHQPAVAQPVGGRRAVVSLQRGADFGGARRRDALAQRRRLDPAAQRVVGDACDVLYAQRAALGVTERFEQRGAIGGEIGRRDALRLRRQRRDRREREYQQQGVA